jgi:hypothetical protein
MQTRKRNTEVPEYFIQYLIMLTILEKEGPRKGPFESAFGHAFQDVTVTAQLIQSPASDTGTQEESISISKEYH